MGDLTKKIDGFLDEWTPNQGPTCAIRALYDVLPDGEAKSIKRLLSSRVYGTEIAKFMHDAVLPDYEGDAAVSSAILRVKDGVIQRHRRGACSCPKGD